MVQAPNIRVFTENFRAINNADIIINGITVVAGENGCGKSTLSKLLYFLYKTISNYDELVKKRLFESMTDVNRFFDIIQQDIRVNSKDRYQRDELRKEFNDLRRGMLHSDDFFFEEESEKWVKFLLKIETLYIESLQNNSEKLNLNTTRFSYMIKDILKKDNLNNDIADSFAKIRDFIDDKFKEAIGKVKSRPTTLFIDELKSVFSDDVLPKKFEVREFDDLIVSLERNHLSIPYSIRNAIYIDTPMMLSVEDSHNSHWDDLNQLLLEGGNSSNKFTQLISKEVIQGDIIADDDIYSADEFKFKREDGSIFNLIDVATGIKAFSILQMLLKNNKLDDKTLLIIDEPESNLHPQWIIEYARIIVLLNKELGIKFFIATHNPDMVSAIRYISEKENNLTDVNFYLAEKVENKFKYNFRFLEKEIDPIFESFNIAIDRINKYGI
jgi:predicted ATPase